MAWVPSARARRMTDALGIELVVVETNAWTLPVPIAHYTGTGIAAALHGVATEPVGAPPRR